MKQKPTPPPRNQNTRDKHKRTVLEDMNTNDRFSEDTFYSEPDYEDGFVKWIRTQLHGFGLKIGIDKMLRIKLVKNNL